MGRINLQDATVVITGASSGMGQATAEAFAARGARLVLAARGPEGLERVADRCRRIGAEVLVVPTDITDADAVEALAGRAVAAFGSIDVWASLAGVGAIGRFHETPADAHAQVIRINLIGHMNDAHAAIPIFMRQGRGVFVNMISLGAYVPTPYAVAYGASKFGLRAFSEALRGELRGWPEIHVCDVHPTFVDTPGLEHGANYTGRELTAPPPLVEPRKVARLIVGVALDPRPTTMVGFGSGAARLAHAVAPELVSRTSAMLYDAYLKLAPRAPVTNGNLFAPSHPAGLIDGGLRDQSQRKTARTLAGVAAVAGTAAALVALSRRRARRREVAARL